MSKHVDGKRIPSVVPIYKEKVLNCGSIRSVKLPEYGTKNVERVLEKCICLILKLNEMHFSLMLGKRNCGCLVYREKTGRKIPTAG